LKEEALDCIKWRNDFGRGCGPVVWQITDDEAIFQYSKFSSRTIYLYTSVCERLLVK
jgi:hypothetical protein